eukprot:GFUD01037829.1.p1 GENE.GFUD01037829.1~~GFUD01037829.1.p1  ORF type:complete len:361 (-),score=72.17 GFUD01037829.1:68-1150(-)
MLVTVNFKYLTLFLAAVAIYLLWMDVGFYLELQKMAPRSPNIPNVPKLNISTPYIYSPFQPITVKLLMLPPTIQFLDEPLAYLTVYYTSISTYISPNAMSLIGVGFAALAAHFFVKEELRYRQFGVLLFMIRDYIDALDGNIYRERSQTHSVGHVANPSSFGWAVDGVCDGFGDIFRFIAFGLVLHKLFGNGKISGSCYKLMDLETNIICQSRGSEDVIRKGWLGRLYQLWLNYRQPITIMMCIALQSLLSSVFWNYFMINYHTVLETDQFAGDINYREVVSTQNNILKSSPMWMVCYFWRLVNPQNITQIQLLAILYGKEADLLLSTQLLGFLPPVIVGMGSYMHLQYAVHAVRTAAFI